MLAPVRSLCLLFLNFRVMGVWMESKMEYICTGFCLLTIGENTPWVGKDGLVINFSSIPKAQSYLLSIGYVKEDVLVVPMNESVSLQ
jgi:hypothetical protein